MSPFDQFRNVTPEPIQITLDEAKIRQVLVNYLDNAVKYSEQGVIAVTATVEPEPRDFSSRQDGDLKDISGLALGMAVRVIDQGIGFTRADQEHFFQKFSRGNNAKAIHVNTATGLGLYIARKFVEGHGGAGMGEE